MKTWTTQKFIEKALKIHNNVYSYDRVNYTHGKIGVFITCKIHGDFIQRPNNHLQGQGCPKCKSFNMKITKKEFLCKANKIYNYKYKYSDFEFNSTKDKIIICCPVHGEFKQSISSHLSGRGCKMCGRILVTSTTQKFIAKANIIHNFKYIYDQVIYERAILKIKIICPIHGIFEQRPSEHLRGSGCFKCSESLGEKDISFYLKNQNIDFKAQHRIANCRDIRPLPFDFAIVKNTQLMGLIEYQGKQHYRAHSFGSKTISGEKLFSLVKKHDKIKYEYCFKNKIPLLIIPYWERKNITLLINDFLDII